MPTYFFHLRSDAQLDRDTSGVMLDSVEAAYLEAYRAVPTMADDLRRRNEAPTRYAFEITDADGELLMELPFSEALRQSRPLTQLRHTALLRSVASEVARSRRLRHGLACELDALRTNLSAMRRLLDWERPRSLPSRPTAG